MKHVLRNYQIAHKVEYIIDRTGSRFILKMLDHNNDPHHEEKTVSYFFVGYIYEPTPFILKKSLGCMAQN